MLLAVRSVNEYAHMNITNFIARVAQRFSAVAAAGASLLVLQLAMLA
jgi:hypothetical protein